MQLLWMLLVSLHLVLDKIYGDKSQFVMINDNWRRECIFNFYTEVQVKSIGILYNEEISLQNTAVLKSIASKGISSFIFEIPKTSFSNLTNIIMSWKSVGINHILFLQRMDKQLLQLWMQILSEMCDETWWLFIAEEVSRSLFEKTLSNRICSTAQWVVYSTSCSTCPNHSEIFSPKMYSRANQSLSKNKYHSELKANENFSVDLKNSHKIIRLAVNESPPYLTLNINEDGTVKLKDGPDAEILRMIAEKIGFQYEIMRPPDGEYGRIKRGNWTGLIGMIARGEADIASGCITITHQRYEATSFSFPYDVQRSVIISKTPGVKPKTYAVILPFNYDVWLMVLFILLSFLFLLYGFGRAYGILYFRKAYKFDRIFWYMLGSMCSEGGWLTFQIQGAATVLVLTLWLLFVLVMQACYCGTLMSVLTFPAYEPAIDNLKDLAKAVIKNGYTCGCLKGTINCDTLLGLEGDLKVIVQALESDRKNFVRSVETGLNKVLEEKFVFVAQQIGSIYRAQLMPEPNFYMSEEGLDIELFSFAARSGLPYLEDIDNMILRLSEGGLIAKWRDDIISMNNMKFATRKSVTNIHPLSLKQLTGAIYMFSYGILFAFMAFIYECIRGKCFNKYNF